MNDMLEYFKSHVKQVPGSPHRFTVVNPIKAFKAVELPSSRAYDPRFGVAALLVPIGAQVVVGDPRDAMWRLRRRVVAEPWNKVRWSAALLSGAPYVKLRASEAVVHSVWRLSGKRVDEGRSHYLSSVKYVAGGRLRVENFCLHDKRCAEGIHFFLTIAEAANYRFW